MSIKVVDLQNEEAKEEPPAIEPIEQEEQRQPEIINEVVEETNEEPTPKQEQTEEPPKPKPKPKQPKASDIVQCPDCSRSMTYKNLRYSHTCSTEPKPVKPQANPKGKAKPKPVKPPPEIYYSDEEEEYKPLSKPVRNQVLKPQPLNPQTALSQHYQLLQQQMMKHKQEKMNTLCQNMFSSKTKKR